MTQEIWKKIEDYPNYEVSNLGNVRSINHTTIQNCNGTITENHYKGKILTPHLSNVGYYRVGLYKDGKVKTLAMHRLVGKAFIPNPKGYPCINHKDGNKTNNCVTNLEWCTQSYNMAYNYKIGISKPLQTDAQFKQWSDCKEKALKANKERQKPIICNETGEVFENSRDCAKKMGLDRSDLMRHLTGRLKRIYYKNTCYFTETKNVKGYTFKYANKEGE